jgi:Lar family restriction alleviation protein
MTDTLTRPPNPIGASNCKYPDCDGGYATGYCHTYCREGPRAMDHLLPCPFCGGEAERLDFETVGSSLGEDPNAGGSCITCKRCGASSPVHFDRKENLYSSWNERIAQQMPCAWMRGVYQPSSPCGPQEYDVELVYGDDQPDGDGWQPLYRGKP